MNAQSAAVSVVKKLWTLIRRGVAGRGAKCIRLGYGMERFNTKYFVDYVGDLVPEPVAYVPTDWVGRPRKWEKERDDGFRRFSCWMRPPVYNWNGTRIPDRDLVQMSRDNMKRCCIWYGSPPVGQELLVCECKECLYCTARRSARTSTCRYTRIIPLLIIPQKRRCAATVGIGRLS